MNEIEIPKPNLGVLIFLIISLLALVVISVGVLSNSNNGENKKENKQNEEKKENNKNTNNTSTWSGIYENNNGTIKIYQLEVDEISFSIETESSAEGYAYIDENTAEGDIFDKYSFVLKDNKIEFTTDSEDLTDGTFTKKKEYSKEEFYEDNIGSINSLKEGLNGIFKNGDITIKIFQTDENKIRLNIEKEFTSWSKPVEINNGTITFTEEFFEDIEKINATITNDTLTITSSSTDDESILNEASGTYKKEKEYTIDEIINDEM